VSLALLPLSAASGEPGTRLQLHAHRRAIVGGYKHLFVIWKAEAGRCPLPDTCRIVQSNSTSCCLQSLLMYDFICCQCSTFIKLPCIAFTSKVSPSPMQRCTVCRFCELVCHGMQLLQGTSKQSEPELDVTSFQASEMWQLSTQDGPQFAALNGDINFIHLHPILARLFGFKSNIAHGVYLVSRSIAAMQTGEATNAILTPSLACHAFATVSVLPNTRTVFMHKWKWWSNHALLSNESCCLRQTTAVPPGSVCILQKASIATRPIHLSLAGRYSRCDVHFRICCVLRGNWQDSPVWKIYVWQRCRCKDLMVLIINSW